MEDAQRVPVTRLSAEEARERWKEVTDDICDMLLHWSPSRDQQTKYQDVLQFVALVLLDASPSSQHLYLLLASLSPKIQSLFHNTCQSCIESLSENATTSVDMDPIKYLCMCLKSHLASLTKGLERLKELMSSGPQFIRSLSYWLVTCFNALTSTLKFCKNVEVEHSWAFEQLAAQLGPMFKSSYNLLRVAVETVTTVRPEKLVENNEEEMEGMEIFQKVLCSLTEAAEKVLHFDPAIVIMTWKALGKMVCCLKTSPGHVEDACPIIASMCTAMRQQSSECVSHGIRREKKDPNSQFSKLLKSCRFFAILITKVVQEFEMCHHLLAQCVLDFLLGFINSLPPSPYCKPLHKSSLADIEANLLVVCEPLCSSMVYCDGFLTLLTTPTDAMREQPFSWSILLCFLLKLFPKLPVSVQNHLFDSTTAAEVEPVSCRLLDSVYSCVRACYAEFSLPVRVTGVQSIGMPLDEVTLYEHVCVHLCATVATTPAKHFGTLERVLLRELLGTDLYSVMLASDVWCFMARWGTSELCYGYVELLCQLVSSISPSSSSRTLIHISSLLRRLVGLLAPQQQTNLCQQYLPSSGDSLAIWLHLPTHSLHPSLQTEICSSLAGTCSRLLQSECSPLTTWLCLQVLLTHDDCWHHIPSYSLTSLVTLWEVSVAVATAGWKNTIHTDVVCSLAHLTSSLLSSFSSSQLNKVFQCIRMILATGSSPVHVLLAVASILSQCGSLELTQDMQDSILSVVVESFCRLFGHNHWLVLSNTLEAFRKFAELTPYSTIVEQCVPPAVNDTVVSFLNKVPSWTDGPPPTTSDLISYLKARHTLPHTTPLSTAHNPPNITLVVHSQRDEHFESLMEAVSVMQSSWEKVRAHPIPLPAKAVEELTRLNQSIQHTLNTNQTAD